MAHSMYQGPKNKLLKIFKTIMKHVSAYKIKGKKKVFYALYNVKEKFLKIITSNLLDARHIILIFSI